MFLNQEINLVMGVAELWVGFVVYLWGFGFLYIAKRTSARRNPRRIALGLMLILVATAVTVHGTLLLFEQAEVNAHQL